MPHPLLDSPRVSPFHPHSRTRQGSPALLVLSMLALAACERPPLEVQQQDIQPRFHDDIVDSGSHFRYAELRWTPTTTPGEVEFRLNAAFRRTAYSGTRCIGGCTGPDGYAGVGDVINELQGGTSLDFGDGSSTGTLLFLVTSIDVSGPLEDQWVLGQALNPGTGGVGVRHSYAGAGPYTAQVPDCCRIGSGLLNNRAGSQYPIQTEVTPLSGNRSPGSGLLPIVQVTEGTVNFVIPGLDPDGDPVRFRLATDVEAGGCCHPPNLSVHPSTGVVTWDNTGLDQTKYWTTQIVVEDLDGSGTPKTKTPVDFLLKIVTGTPPAPTPGTPPSGTTVNGSTGGSVSFTVGFTAGSPATSMIPAAASSSMLAAAPLAALGAAAGLRPLFAASHSLTLNNTGLPPGATCSGPTTGPTVSCTFNWAPGPGTAGVYVITFWATDEDGLSSSPVSIVINVADRMTLEQLLETLDTDIRALSDRKAVDKLHKRLEKARERLQRGDGEKAAKEILKLARDVRKLHRKGDIGSTDADALLVSASQAVDRILESLGFASESVMVLTVAAEIEQLQDDSLLDEKNSRHLIDRVGKALEKLAKGQRDPAAHELRHALKDLQELIRKGVLTQAQAQDLEDALNAAIAAM